ncbi:MAG: DUF192 domain-containing protein [Patescibacteria group bacterium]
MNKKTLLFLFLIFVFAGGLTAAALSGRGFWEKDGLKTIIIGQEKIRVGLAITAAEREKGLSGLASMADDEGLLFVFDSYNRPYFWMNGMRFPLDIIWIRDDKVVGWEKNLLPPEKGAKAVYYQAPELVNHALEVNAGWAEKNHLKIGAEVKIEL